MRFLVLLIVVLASCAPSATPQTVAPNPVLLETVLSSHIPVSDIWRLLRLRRLATSLRHEACFAPEYAGVSTREFLRTRGFTTATIEHFFAPFYGGILLDRHLESSAAVLLFTFGMLATGARARRRGK